LIATGKPTISPGYEQEIEIVDTSDPSLSCSLDDINYRYGSSGGLLGKTPVICGGYGVAEDEYDFLGECLFYGTPRVMAMNSKRRFHSSVTLNTSMLWILGGYGYNADNILMDSGYLASTEYITTNGAVKGPPLPEAVYGACAVKFIENGYVYLIGGHNSSRLTNNVARVSLLLLEVIIIIIFIIITMVT